MRKHISYAVGFIGVLAFACGSDTAIGDPRLNSGGQSGSAIPGGNSGTVATPSVVGGAGVAGSGSGAKAGASGTGAAGSRSGSGGGSGVKAGTGGSAIGGSGVKAGAGGGSTKDSGVSGSKFSFFVTSIEAMRALSKSQNGFGGDLRFGETTGLAGADKICTTVAENEVPGSGQKGWHAFLSTTTVNARSRIGTGPWYDRLERLVALNLTDLLKARPAGAAATIANDLPNERGEPLKQFGDNHDVLTGTNASGDYDSRGLANTCNDWTNAVGSTGKPTIGHAWPRSGGGGGQDATSWTSAHTAPGCAAGVNLADNGAGSGSCVGCAGGYGAIYCFAMAP